MRAAGQESIITIAGDYSSSLVLLERHAYSY